MVKVKYTEKQRIEIEKLVTGFRRIDNNKTRLEKLGWYDLASGIKNIEVTRQIMKDLKAI